jgi:predicted RNA-binding protein with PIN domain
MLWLIDGYNVIRRDPDLRSHEAQSLEAGRRVQLVKQLARATPRDEFIVVFDGARVDSATTSQGQVRILFSRPPETADDLIIRLAGRSRAGSVVVTSDSGRTAGRRPRGGRRDWRREFPGSGCSRCRAA